MSDLPYEYYIDIVTKRYFHAVDNYDLEGVLDCFHSDASLTEVTTMTRQDGKEKGIKTREQAILKREEEAAARDAFTKKVHDSFRASLENSMRWGAQSEEPYTLARREV